MYSKPPGYATHKTGRPFTTSHRIHFLHRDHETNHKVPISPFHDIPLRHTPEILNMVIEIPRFTNAKLEISRTQPLNPIAPDTLHSHPRFVKPCFPYKGYLWNYGALPQTWESPHHIDPDTHHKGDNDPLDAIEIGGRLASPGDVKRVKVLGVLGLIDKGETDWKIVVIDVDDALADKMHDIEDVERELPGLLDATRDWFRIYKVPDGEGMNEFAFGGECKGREYAWGVVRKCERYWRELVEGEVETDVALDNTTLKGTPGWVDPRRVRLPPEEDLSPAPVGRETQEWYFVDRDGLDKTKEEHEPTADIKVVEDDMVESLDGSKLEIVIKLD
ncbi:hypothetical protein OQA88_3282 [Cercophora sp. LCS_1]